MTVKGFTAKQRKWILARDNRVCQFLKFDAVSRKWVLCGNRSHLQVHHILPRGWVYEHLHYMIEDDSVNDALNGITLCGGHHVGHDMVSATIYVVHPDNHKAQLAYRNGNKNAYQELMDCRKGFNQQGIPYWNTRWDVLLLRRARLLTARYLSAGAVSYPTRRT